VKRPTPKQFDVAIGWLEVNEGDQGEAEACQTVARWIEHQQQEHLLKSSARSGGVSIKALRARLGSPK